MHGFGTTLALTTLAVLIATSSLARPHAPPSSGENTSRKCSDGRDNDGDTLVDCADPDCVGHCPENTPAACADGLDNDCDGLIDCADYPCWFSPCCCDCCDCQYGCAGGG